MKATFRLHGKIVEACGKRRCSERPACDFVRSACGRAFGFASLTSLRCKLAVSTERLYFLRTDSAVRAAIAHAYEQVSAALLAENTLLSTAIFETRHSPRIYIAEMLRFRSFLQNKN